MKPKHTPNYHQQINQSAIPMGKTKGFKAEENKKIHDWEFRPCNARFFSGDINSGIEPIHSRLVIISGNHIGENLPPIVTDFQWRIRNPNTLNQKKQQQPSFDSCKNTYSKFGVDTHRL